MHPTQKHTRRAFLGSTIVAGASLPFAGAAKARAEGNSDFKYEFTQTEAEWRAQLSKYEYEILRNGGTEWARTSELWDDYREGNFFCKGCALHLYSSEWRAEIDKGWVFFTHSQKDAVLTAVDKAANYTMNPDAKRTMIEVHCRRCESHLGHILNADNQLVHCINGNSLNFEPAAT